MEQARECADNTKSRTLTTLGLSALGALAFNFLYSHGYSGSMVLISVLSAFFLAPTAFRFPGLVLFSLIHFLFILSGTNFSSLSFTFLDTTLALSILLLVTYGFVTILYLLPAKFRAPTFLFLTLALIVLPQILVGFVAPHRLRLGWSLIIWPLALYLKDLEKADTKIPWWSLLFSLVPSWNTQFFHNVPTEPGTAAYFQKKSPTDAEIRHHQWEGMKLIWIAIGFVFLKLFVDWLCWGTAPFNLKSLNFIPSWQTSRIIRWVYFIDPSVSLWNKTLTVYTAFISMLLHFIVIGTMANAMARFWGFQFPLNVKTKLGLRLVTQWTTMFYYLNNLIVRLFYEPLMNSFEFIRNRKVRSSLALILSIFAFGYCYLIFLYGTDLFTGDRWWFLFQYRGLYLSLVCGLGLIRIWGPRHKKSPLLKALSPYIYFLIMAPLLVFGMLSLDPLFFQK